MYNMLCITKILVYIYNYCSTLKSNPTYTVHFLHFLVTCLPATVLNRSLICPSVLVSASTLPISNKLRGEVG